MSGREDTSGTPFVLVNLLGEAGTLAANLASSNSEEEEGERQREESEKTQQGEKEKEEEDKDEEKESEKKKKKKKKKEEKKKKKEAGSSHEEVQGERSDTNRDVENPLHIEVRAFDCRHNAKNRTYAHAFRLDLAVSEPRMATLKVIKGDRTTDYTVTLSPRTVCGIKVVMIHETRLHSVHPTDVLLDLAGEGREWRQNVKGEREQLALALLKKCSEEELHDTVHSDVKGAVWNPSESNDSVWDILCSREKTLRSDTRRLLAERLVHRATVESEKSAAIIRDTLLRFADEKLLCEVGMSQYEQCFFGEHEKGLGKRQNEQCGRHVVDRVKRLGSSRPQGPFISQHQEPWHSRLVMVCGYSCARILPSLCLSSFPGEITLMSNWVVALKSLWIATKTAHPDASVRGEHRLLYNYAQYVKRAWAVSNTEHTHHSCRLLVIGVYLAVCSHIGIHFDLDSLKDHFVHGAESIQKYQEWLDSGWFATRWRGWGILYSWVIAALQVLWTVNSKIQLNKIANQIIDTPERKQRFQQAVQKQATNAERKALESITKHVLEHVRKLAEDSVPRTPTNLAGLALQMESVKWKAVTDLLDQIEDEEVQRRLDTYAQSVRNMLTRDTKWSEATASVCGSLAESWEARRYELDRVNLRDSIGQFLDRAFDRAREVSLEGLQREFPAICEHYLARQITRVGDYRRFCINGHRVTNDRARQFKELLSVLSSLSALLEHLRESTVLKRAEEFIKSFKSTNISLIDRQTVQPKDLANPDLANPGAFVEKLELSARKCVTRRIAYMESGKCSLQFCKEDLPPKKCSALASICDLSAEHAMFFAHVESMQRLFYVDYVSGAMMEECKLFEHHRIWSHDGELGEKVLTDDGAEVSNTVRGFDLSIIPRENAKEECVASAATSIEDSIKKLRKIEARHIVPLNETLDLFRQISSPVTQEMARALLMISLRLKSLKLIYDDTTRRENPVNYERLCSKASTKYLTSLSSIGEWLPTLICLNGILREAFKGIDAESGGKVSAQTFWRVAVNRLGALSDLSGFANTLSKLSEKKVGEIHAKIVDAEKELGEGDTLLDKDKVREVWKAHHNKRVVVKEMDSMPEERTGKRFKMLVGDFSYEDLRRLEQYMKVEFVIRGTMDSADQELLRHLQNVRKFHDACSELVDRDAFGTRDVDGHFSFNLCKELDLYTQWAEEYASAWLDIMTALRSTRKISWMPEMNDELHRCLLSLSVRDLAIVESLMTKSGGDFMNGAHAKELQGILPIRSEPSQDGEIHPANWSRIRLFYGVMLGKRDGNGTSLREWVRCQLKEKLLFIGRAIHANHLLPSKCNVPKDVAYDQLGDTKRGMKVVSVPLETDLKAFQESARTHVMFRAMVSVCTLGSTVCFPPETNLLFCSPSWSSDCEDDIERFFAHASLLRQQECEEMANGAMFIVFFPELLKGRVRHAFHRALREYYGGDDGPSLIIVSSSPANDSDEKKRDDLRYNLHIPGWVGADDIVVLKTLPSDEACKGIVDKMLKRRDLSVHVLFSRDPYKQCGDGKTHFIEKNCQRPYNMIHLLNSTDLRSFAANTVDGQGVHLLVQDDGRGTADEVIFRMLCFGVFRAPSGSGQSLFVLHSDIYVELIPSSPALQWDQWFPFSSRFLDRPEDVLEQHSDFDVVQAFLEQDDPQRPVLIDELLVRGIKKLQRCRVIGKIDASFLAKFIKSSKCLKDFLSFVFNVHLRQGELYQGGMEASTLRDFFGKGSEKDVEWPKLLPGKRQANAAPFKSIVMLSRNRDQIVIVYPERNANAACIQSDREAFEQCDFIRFVEISPGDASQRLKDLLLDNREADLLSRGNDRGQHKFYLTLATSSRMVWLRSMHTFDIPVVKKGLTGCGKTSVMRAYEKLFKPDGKGRSCIWMRDVIPSHTEDDVLSFLKAAAKFVREKGLCGYDFSLFNDEINVSLLQQLLQYIMVRKTWKSIGEGDLPWQDTWMVAAVNPSDSSGHSQSYDVHNLSVGLQRFVLDCTSLTSDYADFEEIAKNLFSEFLQGAHSPQRFRSMLVFAHKSATSRLLDAKEHTKHVLATSLRDLHRVQRFCCHFQEMLGGMEANEAGPVAEVLEEWDKIEDGRRWLCLFLSLGCAYYFSMPSLQRQEFLNDLTKGFRLMMDGRPSEDELATPLIPDGMLKRTISRVLDGFTSQFDLAQTYKVIETDALKENLFLIFLHAQTFTPLTIIGDNGTSKSLSLAIFERILSLSQKNAHTFLVRPNLKVIMRTVQCNSTLTERVVDQEFDLARNLAEGNRKNGMENTISAVTFEELDMADNSEGPAMKVLHATLDQCYDNKVCFFAVSNRFLDAAKCNRSTVIYRQRPSESALESIVDKALQLESPHRVLLVKYFALAASECITSSRGREWNAKFGMRDLYAFLHNVAASTQGNGDRTIYTTIADISVLFLHQFGSSACALSFDILRRHVRSLLEDVGELNRLEQWESKVRREASPFETFRSALNGGVDDGLARRHILICTDVAISKTQLMGLVGLCSPPSEKLLRPKSLAWIGPSAFQERLRSMRTGLTADEQGILKDAMRSGHVLGIAHRIGVHDSLYDVYNCHGVQESDDASQEQMARVVVDGGSQYFTEVPRFRAVVIHGDTSAKKLPDAVHNRLQKLVFKSWDEILQRQSDVDGVPNSMYVAQQSFPEKQRAPFFPASEKLCFRKFLQQAGDKQFCEDDQLEEFYNPVFPAVIHTHTRKSGGSVAELEKKLKRNFNNIVGETHTLYRKLHKLDHVVVIEMKGLFSDASQVASKLCDRVKETCLHTNDRILFVVYVEHDPKLLPSDVLRDWQRVTGESASFETYYTALYEEMLEALIRTVSVPLENDFGGLKEDLTWGITVLLSSPIGCSLGTYMVEPPNFVLTNGVCATAVMPRLFCADPSCCNEIVSESLPSSVRAPREGLTVMEMDERLVDLQAPRLKMLDDSGFELVSVPIPDEVRPLALKMLDETLRADPVCRGISVKQRACKSLQWCFEIVCVASEEEPLKRVTELMRQWSPQKIVISTLSRDDIARIIGLRPTTSASEQQAEQARKTIQDAVNIVEPDRPSDRSGPSSIEEWGFESRCVVRVEDTIEVACLQQRDFEQFHQKLEAFAKAIRETDQEYTISIPVVNKALTRFNCAALLGLSCPGKMSHGVLLLHGSQVTLPSQETVSLKAREFQQKFVHRVLVPVQFCGSRWATGQAKDELLARFDATDRVFVELLNKEPLFRVHRCTNEDDSAHEALTSALRDIGMALDAATIHAVAADKESDKDKIMLEEVRSWIEMDLRTRLTAIQQQDDDFIVVFDGIERVFKTQPLLCDHATKFPRQYVVLSSCNAAKIEQVKKENRSADSARLEHEQTRRESQVADSDKGTTSNSDDASTTKTPSEVDCASPSSAPVHCAEELLQDMAKCIDATRATCVRAWVGGEPENVLIREDVVAVAIPEGVGAPEIAGATMLLGETKGSVLQGYWVRRKQCSMPCANCTSSLRVEDLVVKGTGHYCAACVSGEVEKQEWSGRGPLRAFDQDFNKEEVIRCWLMQMRNVPELKKHHEDGESNGSDEMPRTMELRGEEGEGGDEEPVLAAADDLTEEWTKVEAKLREELRSQTAIESQMIQQFFPASLGCSVCDATLAVDNNVLRCPQEDCDGTMCALCFQMGVDRSDADAVPHTCPEDVPADAPGNIAERYRQWRVKEFLRVSAESTTPLRREVLAEALGAHVGEVHASKEQQ